MKNFYIVMVISLFIGGCVPSENYIEVIKDEGSKQRQEVDYLFIFEKADVKVYKTFYFLYPEKRSFIIQMYPQDDLKVEKYIINDTDTEIFFHLSYNENAFFRVKKGFIKITKINKNLVSGHFYLNLYAEKPNRDNELYYEKRKLTVKQLIISGKFEDVKIKNSFANDE